jgi:DNA-binding NtrC family response regulator/tetratricopeptide (TPR) repeat protein
LRAAEQSAVYGSGEEVEDVARVSLAGGGSRAWPAPGELTALRRRTVSAVDLLKQGRHAPGERQLRQAVAGLARRDDWSHAGEGAIALASALLARGQPRSAQAVLDDAREYATRAGSEIALIDVAVLAAHAWIDLARLDEAESAAGAAVAAARGINDRSRLALAALGLGRCLFWRGRYADADSVLDLEDTESLAPEIQRRLAASRARVAVGLRDYARAVRLARSSTDRAAAFVHLALDDLDAVERDGRRAISGARAAHDPLNALRIRLMLAEVERRRGRPATADALAARVMRIDPSRLPPIVRARGDLLRDLARSPVSNAQADIVARHVARTGLEALEWFAPDPSRRERGAPPADALVDEILEIVHLCQTADDEATVLSDVCGKIRRHLRSSGVTLFGCEGGASSVVVGDGARTDPGMVERVAAANVPIAPHRCDDRIEAGAPVRYGGMTIGVLTARWPLGTPYDLSRASTMLTAAAVATAPVVSAVISRRRRAAEPAIGTLLGVSPVMSELRRLVERAAAAPFAVLIEGESGSGKELVARAVHRLSARRDRPFTTLNCAALPDELLEAELFGHARGAFTGAVGDRIGVFEEAHGGTLFLDEVGELSPRAQAKLLRVIQEGELRRIGENQSRRVDVRIVAATNRDLRQEAAAGRFRLDLLYRLDVIRIVVPPLRERRDDIAVLVDHCWREATARIGSRATLGVPTIAALARYDWPGNVRELQNVLAALAVRCPRRGVVPPTAVPPPIGAAPAAETHRLDAARRTFEERFVRAALVRSGGHRARAAAELGVTRQGLTKLMTRLGITEAAP